MDRWEIVNELECYGVKDVANLSYDLRDMASELLNEWNMPPKQIKEVIKSFIRILQENYPNV